MGGVDLKYTMMMIFSCACFVQEGHNQIQKGDCAEYWMRSGDAFSRLKIGYLSLTTLGGGNKKIKSHTNHIYLYGNIVSVCVFVMFVSLCANCFSNLDDRVYCE